MTTIFWAGDSTVRQNSILTYPQTGIGQVFERFTRRSHVQIENHAENGRSTKSFLDEGRLAPICQRMQEGDFLFIQFGHNDQKAEDPSRTRLRIRCTPTTCACSSGQPGSGVLILC